MFVLAPWLSRARQMTSVRAASDMPNMGNAKYQSCVTKRINSCMNASVSGRAFSPPFLAGRPSSRQRNVRDQGASFAAWPVFYKWGRSDGIAVYTGPIHGILKGWRFLGEVRP